jgi:PTS system nitrogen regulatory IIA component
VFELIKLTEIVAPEAIIVQLKASSRDECITELVDALIAGNPGLGPVRSELLKKVLDRERLGSTGFGKGVAVPHVKHAAASRIAAAIGLSSRGVDFNAMDKQPVYTVILLLSPENRPEEHLLAMEVIFKNLSKETFRRFLRQATTIQEVRTLLEEADNQQIS